jgi:predicted metal-dependent phosphoesterase TrpH
VSGLREFLCEADRLGVTAIGGSEVSSVYGGKEFHLIGLFIDPEYYDSVEELCREYHRLKEESNVDLVNRLVGDGYNIDYAAVKARNIKGNVNRAHIAAELIEKGYATSISEAFDRLLDEKCGYYIPPKRFELVEAIRFLRRIKALPILAHPLKDIGPNELCKMLPELKEAGLVAIETMHSSYSDEKIEISKKIANDFNLLESGGSDFHGEIKPGISLGIGKGNLNIPDTVYDNLVKYHETFI